MAADTIIHLNITVSGLVQGVGYRYSARNFAASLGITGIIKNLSNGDVYLEAEGTKQQLNQFIDWCYKGPAYAQVKELIAEEGSLKNYNFFEIVR
jgi:acylphosphatase